MRQLAALTLTLLATASLTIGVGRDNNPQSAGDAVPRNSAGLTLDGAMGNPALVGLDRQPLSGLSLLPFSVTLWSDKLAPPLDTRVLINPERGFAIYITKFMNNSFGMEDDLSPDEVSKAMTKGLQGGIGIYAGTKVSPIVFATRGFGLSVSTFADADIRIPDGLLLPFFSATDGLVVGKSPDLSDMRVNAIAASEIAVKLGYSTTIPFLRDYLNLDKGAAGVGLKVLLGHAYIDAKMEKGSALSYDSVSNKYKINARLDVLSAGTGLHGNFRYKDSYLIDNPINGQGWGLDLGAVFHNHNHSVSIDVQDIGMILWNGKEVRKGRVEFAREFDMNDLQLGMKDLFEIDTLIQTDNNYVLWLPTALNLGYAYSLRFHGEPSILLGYLTASMGYNQQLALGVGHDTYLPRLSAGATLGLLAGYLPVRYGMTFGGPEKLVSAFGVGLDARYLSVDAFYKAVGSPALQPARGFELGGGLTVRWGWRRDKVKDAPETAKPMPTEVDSVPEPDTLIASEFFPDEAEPQEVYAPLDITMVTPQPLPEPPPQPLPEPPPLPLPEPPPQQLPEPTETETQTLYTSQRAINFMPGSATLTEGSYAPLNEIADILIQYPHIRYEVQGHTDSQGNEMYNLLLSAERAAVVKYYLMLRDAPETGLVAVGYGKNIPIADNNTVVGRALNRRVEFVQIQSQEHYDWVKRFELEMIPRLTHRIINGKMIIEPKKDGE